MGNNFILKSGLGAFLLCCVNGCFLTHRTQQPGLDGICGLSINKTTVKDIQNLKFRYYEETVQEDIYNLLQTGAVSEYLPWKLLCDSVRILRPDDFEKEGFTYSHAILTFYRDTLVSVSINTVGALTDILKSKYPHFDTKTALGGTSYRWHNQGVNCSCFPDTDGTYIEIEDVNKVAVLNSCSQEQKIKYMKNINI